MLEQGEGKGSSCSGACRCKRAADSSGKQSQKKSLSPGEKSVEPCLRDREEKKEGKHGCADGLSAAHGKKSYESGAIYWGRNLGEQGGAVTDRSDGKRKVRGAKRRRPDALCASHAKKKLRLPRGGESQGGGGATLSSRFRRKGRLHSGEGGCTASMGKKRPARKITLLERRVGDTERGPAQGALGRMAFGRVLSRPTTRGEEGSILFVK